MSDKRTFRDTAALSTFFAGFKAQVPILFGVVPFGMIYGVLALDAGLSPILAQAMSAIVFAGSAQFIGVQLIGVGTPAPILMVTTLIVNLRHFLYSASLASDLKHLSTTWRWLLAYLLTDEAYAVTILHYRDETAVSSSKHFYFLGSGMALWSTWQVSTALGIYLGTQVPASWSLDFTLALTFIGLLMPVLIDWPNLGAALSAGIVAVLTSHLPYQLGLIAAALIGILIGLWLESQSRKMSVPS